MISKLQKARERRAELEHQDATTAFRWVNAAGDGLGGWTLERFGPVGVLSFYETLAADAEERLFDAVMDVFTPQSLYVKRRPKGAQASGKQLAQHAPQEPVRGMAMPELVVRERGLQFKIRPGEGLGVGLYLDARSLREHLERVCGGGKVLNLFAYTGGFSLAARRGGASRAIDVDLSKRVLAWGGENAELNGHVRHPSDAIAGDAFRVLARALKQNETFDCVVLDPPAFSSAGGRAFAVAKQYDALVEAAARVTRKQGRMLACCNQASLTPAAFERLVRQGVANAGRSVLSLKRLGPSPVDFPAAPNDVPALKAFDLVLD